MAFLQKRHRIANLHHLLSELLGFFRGLFRLAAGFAIHQVRHVAQIEQALGRKHELLFGLFIHLRERTGGRRDGGKHARHGVIILRQNRIEFMIVAPRAGYRQPKYAARD